MGLFSRKARAGLDLSPAGPYRATDTVTATVTIPEALDGVTAATVELGYLNGFRYVWAGRAESAMTGASETAFVLGVTDTNPGNSKDSEEWVHVLDVPLTVAGGVLGSGTHAVPLRLPSWSPGSSEFVVRWQARLRVERSGRDVEVEVPLQVLSAAPDPVPAPEDMELVQGERSFTNSVLFDVTTDRSAYRAGETIHGTIGLTAREPITRTALVAAWFRKVQTSHPLDKQPPLQPNESFTPRPMISIARDVMLVQGQRVEFPFLLPIPADVDPTSEAVHASLDWEIQFKVEFSGMTGAIERAQKKVIFYTG
ncbi:hypothetical protein ABIE44_000656 [Marmoricola sp. OAE513]|uniref:hypothetical protein n=1 Tax=Marmoricola sp. OAE513 TaxID=2817894 RepID=UPI001AE889C0